MKSTRRDVIINFLDHWLERFIEKLIRYIQFNWLLTYD